MQFGTYKFPSRRSNVVARNGMVATSQPLAAQAGLAVLQYGGNAIDAAIATVATLCVVEPTSTGIGGDAFALIWSASDQRLYGLNASGPAPDALTSAWIRNQGYRRVPTLGAIPITVPGSLRGWEMALARFGSMTLSQLLAQPIHYAREGFPVSEVISYNWQKSVEKMGRHPDSRRVWLPRGRAPRPSEIFLNEEFANTLELLAVDGPDAFYQGPIGKAIVDSVQKEGGVLTQADLATYQAEWVEPISVNYRRGFTIHEIPPNGQGLAALLAFRILRDFDLSTLDYLSVERVHVLLEAMKLAFVDAHAYIADPDHVVVPVATLLSDVYTRKRGALIRMDGALTPNPGIASQRGDTVYLTVADSDGNMVSWIQSLYMGFGSGITAGNTGIQLQNRGANFSLEPGHPNEVAPGKRPYHTIIPGLITHEGHAWASFGVMGGFMQPQGHLQVGVNLIDYAMDPQAALDAPRFQWLEGRKVSVESTFPPIIPRSLAMLGHEVEDTNYYGGGQVIVRDPQTGVLVAGSEPRNDGSALGY